LNRLIEIFNGEEVIRLDESSLPLQIGTNESAHIRLEGNFEVAAYVGEDRNYLFLQPAENDIAIFHNDQRVTRSVWVKSEDTTRIGTALIHWRLSGQRVEARISYTAGPRLQPPSELPDPPAENDNQIDASEPLPTVPDKPAALSRHRRPVFIGLFILLLATAAFVLLAKPMAITVSPNPDTMDVSGFPPVMKYGDRYLGIIGSYLLQAEKEGYQALAQEIEITRDGSNYSFNMEKLPGLIDLASEPPGATVTIDGAIVGSTPLYRQEIAAGNRAIRFELDRYLPEERVVEIECFGKQSRLAVTLAPAWAIFTLETDPEGATVTVDGTEKGVTPLELELLAGQRDIVFTKPEYTPLAVELVVEAGQDRKPAVYRMEVAPAILKIRSEPAGATVTTGGVYQGRTPVEMTLPAKISNELRLSAAGYKGANHKLTLAPGEERVLDVTLEPEYGTIFIMATPADATLKIDGKTQDSANGRFRLTTQAHTIALQADGYETQTRSITPQAAYSQRVELVLTRKGSPAKATKAAAAAAVETANQTGLGQKLVLFAPKTFRMGASRNEAGRRANETEHEVLMQKEFYLSEREVTNAEYQRFQPQHASGVSGNRSLEIATHPVVNVTWEDAARFMNWLSQRDGLPPYYTRKDGTMVAEDPKGIGYRLPTEAEWAYAARVAGRTERDRYPWPGKFPPKTKAGNFADESARHLLPTVIKGYNDGFAATAPTGSFPANPAGIFDLGGNAAEWCHDYYAANAASANKGAVDPMGPETGSHRVIRGSSWRDASITELRFSYRRYSREPASDIGFRIARYVK
jgi:formylglycine-generating enzyme required for sulfatase activity